MMMKLSCVIFSLIASGLMTGCSGFSREFERAARMPIKAGPHDAEGRVLAASIPVAGPAPELAEQIRDLHRRFRSA